MKNREGGFQNKEKSHSVENEAIPFKEYLLVRKFYLDLSWLFES